MLLAKAESEKKAAEEKKEAAPPTQHVDQAWNFDEANGMYWRGPSQRDWFAFRFSDAISGSTN